MLIKEKLILNHVRQKTVAFSSVEQKRSVGKHRPQEAELKMFDCMTFTHMSNFKPVFSLNNLNQIVIFYETKQISLNNIVKHAKHEIFGPLLKSMLCWKNVQSEYKS